MLRREGHTQIDECNVCLFGSKTRRALWKGISSIWAGPSNEPLLSMSSDPTLCLPGKMASQNLNV